MIEGTPPRMRGSDGIPSGEPQVVWAVLCMQSRAIVCIHTLSKEGFVGKIVCPVCDAALDLDKDELGLFNRLRCEECEALLEVVEEDPIRLEWIEEEDDSEEDEELDSEEEEEDDDYL
jgi:lysine biosynthesis protein LysW